MLYLFVTNKNDDMAYYHYIGFTHTHKYLYVMRIWREGGEKFATGYHHYVHDKCVHNNTFMVRQAIRFG